MVVICFLFIAKQLGTRPQLHNQAINSYNEWFWRLRVWVSYRTSDNSVHSTLMHRSVLQPISKECARTGGHFSCPFYSEKSLSTFIHMVLLQKVAQDLLDLNGKFACTKCEMLSSVPQHYKSRWRLGALTGVTAQEIPHDIKHWAPLPFCPAGVCCFYSVFLSFSDTPWLPHCWRSQGAWDCCFLSTFILRMKLPKEPPKTRLIPHHWL